MAWELNLSWWTDLTYGSIAERVGLERTLDILPSYPSGVPVTVPYGEWKAYASLGLRYLQTAQAFAALPRRSIHRRGEQCVGRGPVPFGDGHGNPRERHAPAA